MSMDVAGVLAQIRALHAQASGATGKSAAPASTPGAFGNALKTAIDNVSNTQQDAQKLAQAFELGDPNADLSSVMLAINKAQVSFKTMAEVRNRLVNAYQEIMNMPV